MHVCVCVCVYVFYKHIYEIFVCMYKYIHVIICKKHILLI